MTSFPVASFASSVPSLVGAVCFFAGLVVASVSDIRNRRIPNKLVVSLALLGLTFSVMSVPASVGAGRALVSCVLGFGLWIPFYVLRMLGAGDVKLFAAASCWLAPSQVVSAALLSAFAGGILSLVGLVLAHGFVLTTFRIAHLARDPKAIATPLAVAPGRKTLPYGLAMAIGLAVVALFPRIFTLT
jgi:prepilin peptidase CpaA